MKSPLAEKLFKELNSTENAESKKTITIKGKTVSICEKYMKGKSYSEVVAYLIAMADEFFTDFAKEQGANDA